jgi:uncharacterized membrane protein
MDQQGAAIYVISTCQLPMATSDDPALADLILFLGPDVHGVPLEIVAIEEATGVLVVIHAMRLRRKYRRAYAQVMRWS